VSGTPPDTTATTHDCRASVDGWLLAAPSRFKVTIRSPRRRSKLMIANRDGPAAGIAEVEEIGGVAAVAILADANEDLGDAGLKSRPGLEHPDHAANRPVRRRLGLIDQEAVDQPVAEPSLAHLSRLSR
jgi:hypothetical protein